MEGDIDLQRKQRRCSILRLLSSVGFLIHESTNRDDTRGFAIITYMLGNLRCTGIAISCRTGRINVYIFPSFSLSPSSVNMKFPGPPCKHKRILSCYVSFSSIVSLFVCFSTSNVQVIQWTQAYVRRRTLDR